MKNISTVLKSHLSEDLVTLAICWRLRRTDGVQMGFTSHDEEVTVDHFTYHSITGFMPTNINNSNDFNVDNLDVKAFLSSEFIKDEDIILGFYDFATVEVFQVNWQDTSMGKIHLLSGTLGEIQVKDHHFIAEIRGFNQVFQQPVGAFFSPECRAELGNQNCHVKLDDFQKLSKVGEVIDLNHFKDFSLTQATGWFDYGSVRWVTGQNSGRFGEVKSFNAGNVILYDALPYEIGAGDIYLITAGCDKRASTCKAKFNNFLNFQGEVAIPGNDALFNYPGLK